MCGISTANLTCSRVFSQLYGDQIRGHPLCVRQTRINERLEAILSTGRRRTTFFLGAGGRHPNSANWAGQDIIPSGMDWSELPKSIVEIVPWTAVFELLSSEAVSMQSVRAVNRYGSNTAHENGFRLRLTPVRDAISESSPQCSSPMDRSLIRQEIHGRLKCQVNRSELQSYGSSSCPVD